MSFFGSSSPSPPPVVPAPPPPVKDDSEIVAAKAKEADILRKQRGRAATLLTGGLGVTEQAPVQRKTLLGA
jgi:hypothetical protein